MNPSSVALILAVWFFTFARAIMPDGRARDVFGECLLACLMGVIFLVTLRWAGLI